MKEYYKDNLILDMKPTSLAHRYAVNGKVSGNLGAITNIDDAMIILVSPIGCGFHYRYSVRARNKLNDLDCVNLKDQDVVFGSQKKLTELVLKLDQEYSPKVIFILPSVVTDILNDDLLMIAENLQPKVKARLLVITSQVFSHMDKNNFTRNYKHTANQGINSKKASDVLYKGCGYVEAMDTLVEQVMEPQAVEANAINVESFFWGYGNVEKLERMETLLKRMGIKVNAYLPLGDIDKIKEAPKAKLNVVRRKKWAITMQERFGTDFFHMGMPMEWHGLEDICQFYREIGDRLNMREAVETVLQTEMARVKPRYEELKAGNGKLKAGLIVSGITPIPYDLRDYMRDFGVQVTQICVIMNNNFAAEMGLDEGIMKRFYARAEEAKQAFGCDAVIHFNPTDEEMKEILKDCDYVVAGRNPRYAKLNKPVLPMYINHAVFDFDSFMEMLEEISARIANPLKVGSKLLLNSLEYDAVFFPREQQDCSSEKSRDVYNQLWRMRNR